MAKKNAKKVQNSVVNAPVEITSSNKLKPNVGNFVITPKGAVFKVLEWKTANEHGMNENGTAYGSLMRIEQNGKERVFLGNPAKKKAEGIEKLSDFYAEVGLETSGQSGKTHENKSKSFAEIWETLLPLISSATDEEIEDAFILLQNEESKRRQQREQKEKDDALIASLSPEVQDLMRRRGLM